MKRFLYSSYTKAVAVLLTVLCAVLCVNVVLDTMTAFYQDNTAGFYQFENSFNESRHLTALLEGPQISVLNAYRAFRDNGNTEWGTELESPREYIQAYLDHLEDSGKMDYFVQINQMTYTNCGAQQKEDLMSARFYMLAQRDAGGNFVYESRDGMHGGHYLTEDDLFGTDTIIVCASIREAYAAEFEDVWTLQAQRVRDAFARGVGLIVGILLMMIYLVAAAGRIAQGECRMIWVDSIWTEVHLAVAGGAAVGAVVMFALIAEEMLYGYFPVYMAKTLIFSAVCAGLLLVLNSLLSIVRKIKCRKFFAGSMVCIVVRWIRRILVHCGRWLGRRAGGVRAAVAGAVSSRIGIFHMVFVLIYTAIIGICGVFSPETGAAVVTAVIAFAFACFLVAYRAKDLDEVKRGVSQVRSGNLTYKIPELRCEDLKAMADHVNQIATGLDQSVAAKLKAERLKTELITNVSHDLKTPLTSIISYTQLLAAVEDLPQEARDYICIIADKSDRLKNITRDLFDISKAQSGNEQVFFEKIDVALLINQSLGEHDSEIRASGLKFCVDAGKELYISADGRKMSRVVSNLIGNILKYTMKNTRVFISAGERDGRIVMEFKNIASYPMEFEADEIIGRFVRGDEARSAEGNGLGLAIAKSYTELCSGSFEVVTDGDLFKAIISFERYSI